MCTEFVPYRHEKPCALNLCLVCSYFYCVQHWIEIYILENFRPMVGKAWGGAMKRWKSSLELNPTLIKLGKTWDGAMKR